MVPQYLAILTQTAFFLNHREFGQCWLQQNVEFLALFNVALFKKTKSHFDGVRWSCAYLYIEEVNCVRPTTPCARANARLGFSFAIGDVVLHSFTSRHEWTITLVVPWSNYSRHGEPCSEGKRSVRI